MSVRDAASIRVSVSGELSEESEVKQRKSVRVRVDCGHI